ncbi:MAG TPA: ABC transporter ATP-binding protein [Acetobacteraceae bacterium]|nr:ABC transporter ATP-binding protein [Acetobacteraceae bacterium]
MAWARDAAPSGSTPCPAPAGRPIACGGSSREPPPRSNAFGVGPPATAGLSHLSQEPPPQPSPATAGEGARERSSSLSPAAAGEGARERSSSPSPAAAGEGARERSSSPSPAVAGEGWGGGFPAPRHRISFVFQDPTLMPWSRAIENVRLPLRLARMPRAESERRAAEALRAVGLAGFERAWPRELSGGMRMRVSLARALVTEPAILLMDEPFAALDEITRHRLNDDLLALWAARGITIVFVTHSVFESVYLASRVLVMAARPGRIVAELANHAPAPRAPGFRTSAGYVQACAAASAALAEAMAA